MNTKIQPFISVIVPVYNTENYIEKTMQSLVRQSFKDFEVILINDETPDNAISIAEHVLSENSVRYITIHQKNKGQGESKNTGVKHASGKWLLFLDSDDILQPETFEYMKNVVTKDGDVNFVFTDYQSVSIGNEFKKAEFDNGIKYFNRVEIQDGFLMRTHVVLAPGVLFNTIWYKNNDFHFKKIPYSDVQLFVWEVLLKTEKVIKIQSPLYNYLQRPGSVMSSTKFDSIIKGYPEFKELQKKYTKSNESTYLTKKYLLSRWVFGILHSSAKLTNKKEFKHIYINLEVKKHCKKMLSFPSTKMRIIALIVLMFPNLSYRIFKKV